MVKIQKLNRPNKRSGYLLAQGETTEVRGLVITNKSAGNKIFVDKFTPGVPKKKKSKKK